MLLERRRKRLQPAVGQVKNCGSEPPPVTTGVGRLTQPDIRDHYLSNLEATMDCNDYELSEHDRAALLEAQDLA